MMTLLLLMLMAILQLMAQVMRNLSQVLLFGGMKHIETVHVGIAVYSACAKGLALPQAWNAALCGQRDLVGVTRTRQWPFFECMHAHCLRAATSLDVPTGT